MKVLWSWLLEFCDLDKVPSVEDGAAALTRLGIEISGGLDECLYRRVTLLPEFRHQLRIFRS